MKSECSSAVRMVLQSVKWALNKGGHTLFDIYKLKYFCDAGWEALLLM
jgi:hypothetical protein